VSGNIANIGGGLQQLERFRQRRMTLSRAQPHEATNTLSGGGGNQNSGGQLSIKNSIVGGNSSAAQADEEDCGISGEEAVSTSLGNNLVGQNGSPNGCPVAGTDTVLLKPISAALDPLLIGNESAFSPYHALPAGSPAIDAIPLGNSCSPPSYDQLDQERPLDGNLDDVFACDIGAVDRSQHRCSRR
jgi:hypothetical protein